MSAYITQCCLEHGEWDMDVDNVSECPKCEEEGKTPYQQMRAQRDELAAALKSIRLKISAVRKMEMGGDFKIRRQTLQGVLDSIAAVLAKVQP